MCNPEPWELGTLWTRHLPQQWPDSEHKTEHPVWVIISLSPFLNFKPSWWSQKQMFHVDFRKSSLKISHMFPVGISISTTSIENNLAIFYKFLKHMALNANSTFRSLYYRYNHAIRKWLFNEVTHYVTVIMKDSKWLSIWYYLSKNYVKSCNRI